MKGFYRSSFMLSAGILALAYAAPCAAQAGTANEGTAAPQAKPENGIADIVVTARRRAESLQHVPVTITALTSADLERKTLRSTEDLRNFVPGVNISGLKRDEASFYIRGQGPGNLVAGQRNFTSVATYFAEVPTAVAGPGVFFDLANVQVLKGPQGTLFGRNTTGGAVLLEPNRPTWNNEGSIQLQGGNYGFKQFDGILNVVPVPDKIALRIAAEVSRRHGFTQSIYTGQRLDGRNYEGMRGSLLLKPFDGFENLTIADYRNKHQSGSSEVIRAFGPDANLGGTVGGNPALAALAGLGAFAGLTPDQVLSIPLTVGGGASIGCLSAALAGCPTPLNLPGPYAAYGGIAAALAAAYAGGGLALVAPTSTLDQILALQQQIGPRKNQVTDRAYSKELDWGITNKTTYQLSDTITLKNIIAFRSQRSVDIYNYSGTPLNFLTGVQPTGQEWGLGSQQFTEEFQIQGRLPSLKTQYIVGVYHEDERPGFEENVPGYQVGSLAIREFNHHDTSNAVFGHLEINPTDFFGISGGVRQTWDTRQSSISLLTATGACNQVDPESGDIACPITYKGDFKALTYDATVSLRPWNKVMFYAAYRHGYKSGGFNLPAPVAPPPLPPTAYQTYNPEYVNEIELGLKADFNVGIPMRVDAAVFHDRYENAQTNQTVNFINPDGTTTSGLIILNNVNTLNRGFEATVTAMPTRNLTVSAFGSYLDAHATNTIPNTITAGQQLANQPKWKYGINGAYTLPLAEEDGSITISADWAWQSRFITDNQPHPLVKYDPSYGVLNGRIEWDDVMHKGFDLALFGTNLLNKTYILGGYPITQLGFDAVIYGEPRMYGGSIKYHF